MAGRLPLLTRGDIKRVAYVITDTCTKDEHCIETCPVNCIHPTKDEAAFAAVTQLYVNPVECIDCGACVPVCPVSAIFALDDLPEKWHSYIEKNANYVTGGAFQADTYKAA